MELFKQARLAGQQAPTSASPALTLQTHTTKLKFFFLNCVLGMVLNLFPHAFEASTLLTDHFLVPVVGISPYQ